MKSGFHCQAVLEHKMSENNGNIHVYNPRAGAGTDSRLGNTFCEQNNETFRSFTALPLFNPPK